ncbi:hypothetical protein [Novosphingobium humi]|uniref:Uncharacterized protein n=1 Tax=Novosphingobium humi TaxID=2282397 RepID=A0ABY7TXK8_9SPHN|nr:hypothetical protein [Novosphingobium humi]WCT77337.1 hypothetical protein PQ457_15685 [Novosphingobium humi]WJS99140.1 hypothetical protein NYQ05_03050 [Novosphingobium humi]
MLTLALAASVPLTMPVAMRGDWDLPSQCHLPGEESDSRAIVRKDNVVFGETVFTPKRIMIAEPANWTATGQFYDEGETSKGRLNLRLSNDGKTLAYTNSDNRIVRLTRCGKK